MSIKTTPLLSRPGQINLLKSEAEPLTSRSSVYQSRTGTGIILLLSLSIALLLEVCCQLLARGIDKWSISLATLEIESSGWDSKASDNANGNPWSAGSASSAIFLLQLRCVAQPAGALTLEGALSTWRFSPACCLIEVILTLAFICDATLLKSIKPTSVALSIDAARYRSYRPLNPGLVTAEHDVEDVHKLMHRCRIITTLAGIIVVSQFVKVVAIRGSPLQHKRCYYL